jgi:predicted nucleic acid-binding Zn ribbon protein
MGKDVRTCQECGIKITGRLDKRFCSDQCRITFNNRINSAETNYTRNVINALRKNRRILIELNKNGKTKVSAVKLKERGFEFRYFTNIYKTKDGTVYYYCFEHGYLPIEKDTYLLVIKQDL